MNPIRYRVDLLHDVGGDVQEKGRKRVRESFSSHGAFLRGRPRGRTVASGPRIRTIRSHHRAGKGYGSRMALGLGVTYYSVTSYDSLFFNQDQPMYVYKI